MKRVYRDRALSRLYAELGRGEFDAREYALFQLALMLRRVNSQAPSSEAFSTGEHLPRDLQRIHLSPADQAQIASYLMQLISRYANSRASALWVLGEVSAVIAFDFVLAAIRTQGDQFSDEAAYQACRALQKWLAEEDLGPSLSDELRGDDGPMRWLMRWSRSTDGRLAQSARTVIRIAKGYQHGK